MTDKKSPWSVLGEKLAGVLIEAVDAGVAEVKRKAEAPPPNVVPIRPVDQAAEIELLKAEIDRLDSANTALRREVDRLCLLATEAKEAIGPLCLTSDAACRANSCLMILSSSPYRTDTST